MSLRLTQFIVIGTIILMVAPYKLQMLFPYMDKVGHLVLYGILTYSLSQVLTIRKSVLIAFCIGIATEVTQYFVAARSFSLKDLAANALGVMVCWIILLIIQRVKSNETVV